MLVVAPVEPQHRPREIQDHSTGAKVHSSDSPILLHYLLCRGLCFPISHPALPLTIVNETVKEKHPPFNPVLSGSTCTLFTTPSRTHSAYLFPRSPPKIFAPSNAKSSARVNSRPGSARKRICIRDVRKQTRREIGKGILREGIKLTPLLPLASRVDAQAFMLHVRLAGIVSGEGGCDVSDRGS